MPEPIFRCAQYLPDSPILCPIDAIKILDVTLALIFVALVVTVVRSRTAGIPGPYGLPFVGVALQIPDDKQWLKFHEWTSRYGTSESEPRITDLGILHANYSVHMDLGLDADACRMAPQLSSDPLMTRGNFAYEH